VARLFHLIEPTPMGILGTVLVTQSYRAGRNEKLCETGVRREVRELLALLVVQIKDVCRVLLAIKSMH
jgi:hypothetical protein